MNNTQPENNKIHNLQLYLGLNAFSLSSNIYRMVTCSPQGTHYSGPLHFFCLKARQSPRAITRTKLLVKSTWLHQLLIFKVILPLNRFTRQLKLPTSKARTFINIFFWFFILKNHIVQNILYKNILFIFVYFETYHYIIQLTFFNFTFSIITVNWFHIKEQ